MRCPIPNQMLSLGGHNTMIMLVVFMWVSGSTAVRPYVARSTEGRLPGWLGERTRESGTNMSKARRAGYHPFHLHMDPEATKNHSTGYAPPEDAVDAGVERQAEAPNPSSGSQAKACFLTLARGNTKGKATLARLIHNIDAMFAHAPAYPLVVFHEGMTPPTKHSLQELTARTLEFAEVTFEVPSFISKDARRWPYPGGSYFSTTYRHMCRFFAVELYKQPVLDKYDWYMRLDTDSFLLAPYTKDPFQHMMNHGKQYAFNILFMQGQAIFLDKLWDTVAQYVKDEGIKPASTLRAFLENGRYSGLHFWDNFEIGYLPFWKSEPVQKFIDYIDKSGGIYYHRWGDAELHTLTVALFMAGDKLWYTDIPYQHYFYYRCPKNPSMRENCLKNATKSLFHGEIRKEPGSVMMEPAENHEISRAFLQTAKYHWHWTKSELESKR